MVGGTRAQFGTTCGMDKPCRWADVELSDGEETEEEDVFSLTAPVVDDSYREPPLSALEDSRDGLNRKLSGIASLNAASPDPHAPKDFAFLLTSGAAEAKSQEDCPSPRASAPRPSQDCPSPQHSSWRPNLNAPEFIPTMSHACPFVGTVVLGEDGKVCNGNVQDVFTPEKGNGPSHGQRRDAAKRRPTMIQVAPAKKRTKSEERGAVQPPEKAQAQTPMPEVTEEEWQHRAAQRRKAIDVGKKTREYQWYTETKQCREREEAEEPLTPNPTDRMSKRRWKYNVMQWRITMKQRYIDEGGGSVVSTEEWQSTVTGTTEDVDGCRSLDLDDGLSV
uniref:Histone RNA hairpin-binding protein RNA-binding domain-containing protein n=1 Tax=Strombidinopsis acuminata TaxID=141414 RepID=A0A7S3RYQ0_9SPIT|mmetsp:Transcript_81744/g.210496  ORF Transcript_81744/g.210496 Transcript_81744/m.210496 type:complete len:334 (+) Transcript_81744:109-1110(+)